MSTHDSGQSSVKSCAMEITEVRLLGVEHDQCILRFVVNRYYAHQKPLSESETFRVIRITNEVGDELRHIQPIIIGTAERPSPSFANMWEKRICASIKISSPFKSLDIDIEFDGEHVNQKISTECVDTMRSAWLELVQPAEQDESYPEWFENNHVTVADIAAQRMAWRHFDIQPVFSIIVPLYHTPIAFFREMAASVLGQSYPKLELILVNSTPEDCELARECDVLSRRDERVRVVTLKGNRGISENTKAGVERASGDFISFFDHDDLLEPDCFYWYVKGINDYPDTDMLYCDEDKYESGKLSFPFFKPDYDEILLETNNYICHLLTIRKRLLDSMPAISSDLDGAQDHSMALAAGELSRNVYHVRRVLYHWRIHSASTAGDISAKPESLDAGKLAVCRHLDRVLPGAKAEPIPGMPHYYQTVYVAGTCPTASIMLYGDKTPDDNRLDPRGFKAGECVKDVFYAQVDCNDVLKELVNVAKAAKGDYLIIMSSSSTPCSEGWADELVSVCSRRGVGIVAPIVLYPDRTVKDAGLVCSFDGIVKPILRDISFDSNPQIRGMLRCAHQVSSLRGDCLVLSKDLFIALANQVADCPGMYWDVALCLEARRSYGLGSVLVPSVKVISPLSNLVLRHSRKEILSRYVFARSWLLKKWPEVFSESDNFYNKQLKQDGYYGLIEVK